MGEMKLYNPPLFLLHQFDQTCPTEIRQHSLCVAERCALGGEALLFAGLFHDIGKGIGGDFHPISGAEFLVRLGEPDLAELVARHSGAALEAELLGQEMGRWSGPSPFLREQEILDQVDLTTSPDGRVVSLAERAADIRERYGADSVAARALELFLSERGDMSRPGIP